jgi:hypothetical protein
MAASVSSPWHVSWLANADIMTAMPSLFGRSARSPFGAAQFFAFNVNW